MFFWNSLVFSTIQRMLAIWSLVPLPFLKPVWTSGSSQFMYHWSLAWRILSITLLACEMSAIVRYFEHSLALPFFGIGMKTDLFQSCGHCWVFQSFWHMEWALSQHYLQDLKQLNWNSITSTSFVRSDAWHISLLNTVQQVSVLVTSMKTLKKENVFSVLLV